MHFSVPVSKSHSCYSSILPLKTGAWMSPSLHSLSYPNWCDLYNIWHNKDIIVKVFRYSSFLIAVCFPESTRRLRSSVPSRGFLNYQCFCWHCPQFVCLASTCWRWPEIHSVTDTRDGRLSVTLWSCNNSLGRIPRGVLEPVIAAPCIHFTGLSLQACIWILYFLPRVALYSPNRAVCGKIMQEMIDGGSRRRGIWFPLHYC